MARVALTVGGRDPMLACRDGEEEHVRRLGAMLEARAAAASRGAGNGGPERMMLLIALMLADDLNEAGQRPAATETAPDGDATAAEALLVAVADRLEAVAMALEQEPATS